jgi:hypothetical protein
MAERVLDRDAHVGDAEVRLHRPIRELDHRVHRRLRVHHDADVVVADAEEVVRLDGLEALVHERGGVDGDLRAHGPPRVSERLRGSDVAQVGGSPAAERTTRRGQPDARKALRRLTEKALEYRGVFAVDGDQARAATRDRRGSPRKRHEQFAAHDERLLVRERETLARSQGGLARAQSRGPDERVQDDVGVGVCRERRDRGRSRGAGGAGGQVVGGRARGSVGDRQRPHAQSARLLGEKRAAAVGRERDHTHALGESRGHLECLSADRPGGSQDREPQRGAHAPPPNSWVPKTSM